MHTPRPWLALTIGPALALAIEAASAAGLGPGTSSAVLGQPLDFAVQVRLDPGEALTAACVTAEVTAGDRRLPSPLVRAVVEMTSLETARVRVLTDSSIDEPVVGIQLTVGCNVRLSRRYVVLADPPFIAMAGPGFLAQAPAAVGGTETAAGSPPGAAGAFTSPSSTPGLGADPARPTSAAPRAVPDGSAAEAVDSAELRAQAQRRAERRATRLAVRQRSQAQARAEAALSTAAASQTPRLKLDAAESPLPSAGEAAVEDALAAVAQAASAAQAAASAAAASAQRIATLERTVEQLRTDSQVNRELAAQFRQRLAQAEGGVWLLPLTALAALLAALTAWLAWRLGRVQAERQRGWQAAVGDKSAATKQEASPSRVPTAPIPFVTSELTQQPPLVAPRRASPAWPPPAPPVVWPSPASTLQPEIALASEPPIQRTEPMPPGLRHDEEAPRDVSIEELIDLEQQAEFFVVLGQDEAAIDLLVEHLRSTGGGSPLPYLKLLEIHHRCNDREAYERMRSRFNQRFNAYAPEWGMDLGHGRTLEAYAGVIPRLSQVWPQPLDAMAELEALLFRKSRGELFDLPAYREVLFLYSLARDLLDRSAADNGSVDLLLPIAEGTQGQDVAASHPGLNRSAFRDTLPPEELPTVMLDFDVSAAERATSIFDLLGDKPPPPPHSPRGP